MTGERNKQRLPVRLAIIAAVILVACLAFNLIEYGHLKSLHTAHGLYGRRNILYAAAYLVTYITAVAAIIVCVFSKSAVVRWLSLALVVFFVGAEMCSVFLTNVNVGFSEVNTALTESTFIGEFMSSYSGSVLKAAAVAFAFGAVLYALIRLTRLRFSLPWLALVPLALLMSYGVVWRTVAMTDIYPSPIRIPVLTAYALMNSLDAGPRRPVEFAPDQHAQRPRVIILIMDESVRSDYLAINGWKLDTCPYLQSTAGRYLNFGTAAAASNLSSSSNHVIRSGLRDDEIPDYDRTGLTNPSIYQYAQETGYRTCYLDGQYAPGVLENFLSAYDLEHIDETYWAIGDEPDLNKKYRRDRLLAQRILELVDDGQPLFIWVNKYGTHIHYDNAYPPSQRVFTPTMPPNRPLDTCTLEEIENSYSNAIRWAADGFLETLLPELDLRETVVVYTSDHGQSFLEGGATHADRLDPPVSQANVPLLTWGQQIEQRFPDGAQPFHDKTSHFQIFPTLLIVMGYPEDAVVPRHGQPLWGTPPSPRVFVSGDVFGRGIARVNTFDSSGESTDAATAP